MRNGYVQIYTGNGKGKTTAALGLALRATGAGLKVYIGQFIKEGRFSEIKALDQLGDSITYQQFGRGSFLRNNTDAEDTCLAQHGLDVIRQVILSGDFDLVILDEANIATYYGLVMVDDFVQLIKEKPEHVELILTGRHADPRIIECADLVTEMVEVKHYYQKGILARDGIER